MAIEKETCLVIGGCGFLGRVIVNQLLESAKWNVRIFDLRKTFDDDRVEFMVGDITKLEDVLMATKGVTAVIHTASPPHGRGKNAYIQVNFNGTKNVIDACKQNGVKSLVYTSSASVIYNGQDLIDADETIPYCEVHMDAYNETKAIGEEMILKANSSGLKTVALRPSGIFGPRDMQGASTIIDACLAGKNKVQIGLNKTLFDWTYVDNIAYAHILAMDKMKASPCHRRRGVHITNDQPVFFWDFVKLLWFYLGYQDTLKFALPLTVAFTLAWITEMFATMLSPIVAIHPTFTVFRIKIFANNRYFDVSKAKKLLGYKPIVSLEEGIARTVAYFEGERKKKV
ncbi:3beta-hydroxysteroid dehydrogenase [Chytridium lagenaria]|nr:3beta-hydroxysteroid dehydrogenase [Chytridium lagenaria]